MKIPVIIEPQYKDTLWCRQTWDGICEKAGKLRYDLVTVTEENISNELSGLIVVGTTPLWVDNIIRLAEKYNIYTVNVSCHPGTYHRRASYVIPDHAQATEEILCHYRKAGKNKCALYGINRHSYADTVKTRFFEPQDIFYNNSNLSECFSHFSERLSEYDCVLCANYIAAVSLINSLNKQHVSCSLPVSTFGDSVIGKMVSPSLTEITLDHHSFGVHAVSAFSYLAKQPDSFSMTVTVPCRLSSAKVSECTEAQPEVSLLSETESFYDDTEVKKIERLERLFSACESVDRELIDGIAQGSTYEMLSKDLFLSENALKYRMKRLLTISGFTSKTEMISAISEYIGNL